MVKIKRKGTLYQDMLDFNTILFCYNEVIKHTKNKKSVLKYNSFKCINIYHIYNILKNKNYELKEYHVFKIYEPKERTIVSLKLMDKVINHLVTRCILIPSLIPSLIDQNVATRPNMGTSKGIEIYKKYRQTVNKKYDNYYILKCDISKFFSSINHDILKEQIKRKIKENDALQIINTIIDSYPKGLPIGNMTSQILAIYYLNEMDRYIKETLKIKYYVRYQDDFILFHQNKEYLKYCLVKIKEYLKNNLDLKLNNKTRIYNKNERIIFIGLNKSKGSINRKLLKKKKLYEKNYIKLNSYLFSIASYKGRN